MLRPPICSGTPTERPAVNHDQATDLTLHCTKISDKTHWLFVELTLGDGRQGVGEATLPGKDAQVLAAAQLLADQALQASWRQPSVFATTHPPGDLASAAFISAVDHALWDLHAQDASKSVCEMLGGARRTHVPLYANINRRTVKRTPVAFARSAIDAMAAGFSAFKIAPFDEVQPDHISLDSARDGIARVLAVREVIGPERRLMVDCHWRFNEATAKELITQMAQLKVHWVECPIAESHDNVAALVRLRSHANLLGVQLAGLELAIGPDDFMPYVQAGAYDVVMPDVKYFGGLQAMQQAADVFARYKVQISPHNPTGPVCHAASLQVAAAMGPLDMLELQFDESPLFGALVDGVFTEQASSLSALPLQPGLGVRLNIEQLKQLAVQPPARWQAA
jgi:galactonate dehydratase